MLDEKIEEAYINKDLVEKLLHTLCEQKSWLSRFPEREKKIIEMRFGLNGEREKTLKEIGEIFNICKERVRGVEAGALRKMKVMYRRAVIDSERQARNRRTSNAWRRVKRRR